MELNGVPAPEFPNVGNAGLIGHFEAILADELSRAV
jgi:hypothetical protein